MKLENIVENMKKRPCMYLGNRVTIEAINHFLNGILYAKVELSQLSVFELEFRYKFGRFIDEKYPENGLTFLWNDVIKANSKNEEDAVNKFFELFDEFYEMHINDTLDDFLDIRDKFFSNPKLHNPELYNNEDL